MAGPRKKKAVTKQAAADSPKKPRKPRSRSSKHVNYLGAAGESLTAYRLSLLGYAVSVPLNDQGDDLFAVNMSTDRVLRVQVKTASKKSADAGAGKAYTSFQVGLKKSHLSADNPDLVFCFHLVTDADAPKVRSLVLTQMALRNVYKKTSTTLTFLVLKTNLASAPIYLGGSPPQKPPKKPSKKSIINASEKWEDKWSDIFPRIVNIAQLAPSSK